MKKKNKYHKFHIQSIFMVFPFFISTKNQREFSIFTILSNFKKKVQKHLWKNKYKKIPKLIIVLYYFIYCHKSL